MPTRTAKAAKPMQRMDEAMRAEPSTPAALDSVKAAHALAPKAPEQAPKETSKKATKKAAKTAATREGAAKAPAKSSRKTAAKSAGVAAEMAAAVAADLGAPAWHAMVAEAAYFIAMERGFPPGRALDDWLQAEQALRADEPAAAS